MSRKQKKMLTRILASAVLFALSFLLPLSGVFRLFYFITVYAVVGWDVLWRAARNIAHGQVFDENFLMALATIGAFVLGEFPEAVEVMLFYQIGELFQSYAVGKSRQSITALMDIRPDYANIERDGALEQVDPDEVAVGDIIVIKAGEKIPLDGVIIEGSSSLDTAALTGESLPREVAAGDDVISGCINQSGLLRVRVSKEFGESTVSKILDLVENSSSKKARAENFITKFARYYTPVVVIGAVLLALLPPLLLGGSWNTWIERALIFLVISCPCALVISIHSAFSAESEALPKLGFWLKAAIIWKRSLKPKLSFLTRPGPLPKGYSKLQLCTLIRCQRAGCWSLRRLPRAFPTIRSRVLCVRRTANRSTAAGSLMWRNFRGMGCKRGLMGF